MKFENMIPAIFIKRKNRFVAKVSLDNGEMVEAHLANTGRMQELLVAGRRVLLTRVDNPDRATEYDLWFIENKAHEWVCLRAVFANALVQEWLHQKLLKGFEEAEDVVKEYRIMGSRFDFKFMLHEQPWLAEVKSVNYVAEDGMALFPDAPTKRGKKHLEELVALQKKGYKTAVFFVTMGAQVKRLKINKKNDPEFAEAFLKAREAGVEIRAWASNFTGGQEFFLEKEITTIEV